jgi:hypothetical protein
VDRSVRARFIPLDHSLFHVGPRSCGIYSLDHSLPFVGSFFRSWESLFGSAFRAVDYFRWSCGRLCPSLLGEFSCGLLDFEVRTLGGEFLKGIFAL